MQTLWHSVSQIGMSGLLTLKKEVGKFCETDFFQCFIQLFVIFHFARVLVALFMWRRT